MLRNEYSHLCSVLTAGFMVQLIDGIEDSPIWKHKLKNLANSFRNEMIKICNNEMAILRKVDDVAMLNVMKLQEELLEELADVSPNEYPVIIQFLKLCRQDPDAVFEKLNMEIIRQ